MHARAAFVALALIIAATALRNGVACVTAQCVLADVIVRLLTLQQ
jgi:hypothetical protein